MSYQKFPRWFFTTEFLDGFGIVATNVRDTNATLEFTESAYGEPFDYVISVTPADGGTTKEIVVAAGTPSIQLGELDGGTSYDVELVSRASDGQELNSTSTSFTTRKFCCTGIQIDHTINSLLAKFSFWHTRSLARFNFWHKCSCNAQ